MGTHSSWRQYLVKNIKCILLPFYFFAFISLIIRCVYTNTYNVIPDIKEILVGGIRNHYFAGSLWFLTCLFIVKIIFHTIRNMLKFKPLILASCVTMFIVVETIITPRPIISPNMPYNIDSACYYIIFYVLGYYCFGYIRKILTWDCLKRRAICMGLGVFCLVYDVLLFAGKNILNYVKVGSPFNLLISVLGPMITIFLVLIVSRLLEDVYCFNRLGKNTLYLCGSEYIIKLLVPICFETIGLNISLTNPISIYFYTFFLLIICEKTLVPLEKKYLRGYIFYNK